MWLSVEIPGASSEVRVHRILTRLMDIDQQEIYSAASETCSPYLPLVYGIRLFDNPQVQKY